MNTKQALLARKIKFLQAPANYPESTSKPDVITTHMSVVFLTDTRAYKMKKPVKTRVLDFSTLEKRRADCELEVRLNRRLAGDVYRGTVSIREDNRGDWTFGGSGEPVEWLVKMRRLPRERMLDYLIEHAAVSEDEIVRVATRLSRFYRSCDPLALNPVEYRARYENYVRENRDELLEPGLPIDSERVHELVEAQLAYLARNAALLASRVEEGHILEAHGDLRPEHICLEPDPVIFDCLEFRREFRILDAADELAFLSLECERLGASFVGPLLFRTYSRILGDTPPEALIRFYRSYRAALRAKLAVWHLPDAEPGEREHWIDVAREYLDLGLRSVPEP